MLKISKHLKTAKKISHIEQIRRHLKTSDFSIKLNDLGAGSKFYKNITTFSRILRNSTSPAIKSLILALICKLSKSKSILELGTNLGLNAFYLAALCPEARITTIEGDIFLYRFARRTAKILNLSNITFVNENFDKILGKVLTEQNPQFVFIDGNHTFSATLRYFKAIDELVDSSTTIVLDDIHWTDEMVKAWKLLNSPRMVKKIDFYKFGIIKLKSKQDASRKIRKKT